ncbi:hypothetical protein SYNPS1DRAFT_33539 [Syncephalis pseudoplumigaleata]|uniref:ATP12-domain-containing protein n=1 Tax=Syncephalis pseudoplumigaleata TaxID=1712513 RepID=A0A4P9YV64_9FUNG|nr:hypothetical protein SYNPS1DRAFT_33539 [Syncephalis pseudoplumigaleata]|eukprot:RKP22800.1 hypothetical protein SYNPS1DRAFT_33539 [Syncephalis pseudoplumigaleata]
MQQAKSIKRFWKKADIKTDADAIQVMLDGRSLKTIDGHPCRLSPDDRCIAVAVAGEWESATEQVKPHGLAVTSIVARAIDTFGDAEARAKAIDKLMAFLHRDTLCYEHDHPSSLVELQSMHWRPLVEWARQRYQVELTVTNSIMGIQQPQATVDALRAVVATYSPLQLAAFEQAVLASKSFIIALALTERQINVQQAVEAAQAEVLAQIKQWGMVEDGHDLDFELLHQQLGAASCAFIGR